MNIDLAEVVEKQITEHPETHNQSHYGKRTDCGTAHCIAGWAAVLSPRAEIIWETPLPGASSFTDGLIVDGHRRWNFEMAARELLDLTVDQGHALFFNFDDAGALKYLRELIEEAKATS